MTSSAHPQCDPDSVIALGYTFNQIVVIDEDLSKSGQSIDGQPHLRRTDCILVIGDTVLDKPYAHTMWLVGPFWFGKHQWILGDLNLVPITRIDGNALDPTDYRLVEPADAPKRNKNEHFREMLVSAKARGFTPRHVCSDSWYFTRTRRDNRAKQPGVVAVMPNSHGRCPRGRRPLRIAERLFADAMRQIRHLTHV
ncbi:MAG: hypothetical protein MUF18_05125 [Fimbriiglobus sp.]|nr:hypothetical protein [Fimbriiglobus sp.]